MILKMQPRTMKSIVCDSPGDASVSEMCMKHELSQLRSKTEQDKEESRGGRVDLVRVTRLLCASAVPLFVYPRPSL